MTRRRQLRLAKQKPTKIKSKISSKDSTANEANGSLTERFAASKTGATIVRFHDKISNNFFFFF